MKNVFLSGIISTLMFACKGPAKTATDDLRTDTSTTILSSYRWKLKELAGKTIGDSINGQEPIITFNATDSSVAGHMGCNRFGGKFQINGETIHLSRFFSTKMACHDMWVESTFLGLVDSIDRFMVTEKELHLMRGDEHLVMFDARPL